MRYFFDTEFIEYPCTIDLVSIGMVCEDGREFYAESSETDWSKASQWVRDNVRPQLAYVGEKLNSNTLYTYTKERGGFGTRKGIATEIKRFIETPVLHGDFVRSIEEPHNTTYADKPEFWAYYGDYDWVAFCWLFGSMIDLPEGFPMYCRDLKQWADQLGARSDGFPTQVSGLHNALHDARWNAQLHNHLHAIDRGVYGRHAR